MNVYLLLSDEVRWDGMGCNEVRWDEMGRKCEIFA